MPKIRAAYRFLAVSMVLMATPALAQHQQSTSPPLSFGRGVASVDPQQQDRWIELDADGLVIMPIMLNGQRLMAMVDTGAPTTTVDADWATRHGLRLQPYQKIRSMGGNAVQAYIAPIDRLQIAGFQQAGGSVQVTDLSPLSATAGTPIDAVIGVDFLSAYAVTLDLDKHRIRFQPSGSPHPSGDIVPVELRDHGRGLSTKLFIGKHLLSSVMIDTGDDASMAITKSAWHLSDAPLRLTDIASTGLSGDVILSELGRVDGVRFGSKVFDKVPMMFEPAPLVPGDEARIGMKLLNRFNIFLDIGQRVMVLSPRSVSPTSDPITMSGIQGMWSDAGLQIVHVMKGSPAEALRLRAGDRICAIDGTRITADDRSPLRTWSLGPAGKVIPLTMCDGRILPITLQEFY
ncbi:aspartyl protease family protein [Sphingomonas sp.]|uniref:aspartyl protease family protein n=1 Tax=Sphingomonas sp. TaxID=28214 RepID=UPI0031D1C8A9